MTLALSEGATRAALTFGVLAAWVLGVWGMRRGWRHRAERTSLGPLPTAPDIPGVDAVPPLLGVYLGTTLAGQWLERVADRHLGGRSSGRLRVLPTGVLFLRAGFDDLFVPRAAMRSVRIDTAHAGTMITGDGMLVLTWHHDDRLLETGFRADQRARHREVEDALTGLLPADSPPNLTQESL